MNNDPELYNLFVASIHQGSVNALTIFGIALCVTLAYCSLEFVPERYRPFVKLTAWCYAIAALTVTIFASL